MECASKIESWTQMYLHLYSNMDAHELMLRRSQYICVLSLVNARFSILERQKTPYYSSFPLGQEIRDSNHWRVFERRHVYLWWGLVMSEIHRRRPWLYKCEFSFVRNDRRPSQKSGTRRENINAPDSPDLTPSIPDALRYLRFLVFISRQNLGQSGNSKIPDTLECSRHMKTRLSRKKSKWRGSALNKVNESFLLAEAAELALWEENSLTTFLPLHNNVRYIASSITQEYQNEVSSWHCGFRT